MSFCVVIFSSTNIRWSDSCSVVVISTAEILLPKNQAGNCFHRGGVKTKKVQNIIIKYQQAFLNCVSTLYWEMKICYLLHYFHFSFFEFTFINKGKWRCFSHLNGSQFSLFDIAYTYTIYYSDALLSTLEVVVLWWFAGIRSRFIPLILQSFCDSWFCTCCLSSLALVEVRKPKNRLVCTEMMNAIHFGGWFYF